MAANVLVFQVVLILCTIKYSLAEVASICVKSDEAAVCQIPDDNRTIHRLSELPALLQSYSDVQTLHVYLSSGIHSLTTSLNFATRKVEIEGAWRSIVQCRNLSGVKFDDYNNRYLLIKNLIFKGCNRTISFAEQSIHAALYFESITYTLINVTVTGSGGYGLFSYHCDIQVIENCTFDSNKIHVTMVVSEKGLSEVNVTNSKFTRASSTYGVTIKAEDNHNKIKVTIENSHFTGNKRGGLEMLEVRNILIDNCSIRDNTGTGIAILKHSSGDVDTHNKSAQTLTKILNSHFSNNTRALYLNLTLRTHQGRPSGYQYTVISACNFTDHYTSTLNKVVEITGRAHMESQNTNMVTIENSLFRNNSGTYYKCSSIYLSHLDNITFENLTISDNHCSGIALIASNTTIKNKVDLIRNTGSLGGAMKIFSDSTRMSKLMMTSQSHLNIINNTAKSYGGGILVDKTCQHTADCFFQFKDTQNLSTAISLFGNRAMLGGDMVFGGCLTNCLIELHGTKEVVDATNTSNIFWDFVSSEYPFLPSAFADQPNRVVFCDFSEMSNNNTDPLCTNTVMTVRAFRGQSFKVPLMAVDSSCSPSAAYIQANTEDTERILEKRNKLCSNHSYSVNISDPTRTHVDVNFQLYHKSVIYPPATLTVELQQCPNGYSLNTSKGICACNDVLKSYDIECVPETYSLRVPALTWIGKVDGVEVVQKHCQYCKRKVERIHSVDESDKLCARNRTGIMCGRCVEGYSLQLSGNQCADCRNSLHKAILVSILFIVIGILLIVFLLTLNLTVSTGILNALIFYSNIVYINRDDFLPVNTESGVPHKVLHNMVRFLSAFQAWMNLDFGFAVCFFSKYNAYISTWSQFALPHIHMAANTTHCVC